MTTAAALVVAVEQLTSMVEQLSAIVERQSRGIELLSNAVAMLLGEEMGTPTQDAQNADDNPNRTMDGDVLTFRGGSRG